MQEGEEFLSRSDTRAQEMMLHLPLIISQALEVYEHWWYIVVEVRSKISGSNSKLGTQQFFQGFPKKLAEQSLFSSLIIAMCRYPMRTLEASHGDGKKIIFCQDLLYQGSDWRRV